MFTWAAAWLLVIFACVGILPKERRAGNRTWKIRRLILEHRVAPDFEIHIFAWRRVKSLKRLLDSLERACAVEQMAVSASVTFHVDHEFSPGVLDAIGAFSWKYGRVHLNIRRHVYGMPHNILNGWQPAAQDRFALLLEDDLAVSPHFIKWVTQCIVWLKASRSTGMMGCSLYTPMVDEVGPAPNPWSPPRWAPSREVGDDACFFFQLPCSWGAVYRSDHWLPSLQYYALRSHMRVAPDPPGSRTVEWFASWKRFLIELMLEQSWYLLYPNSGHDHASFSTNYFEKGVHSVPEGMVPDYTDSLKLFDRRFTVPLIANATVADRVLSGCASGLGAVKVVALYHKRVKSVEGLRIPLSVAWRERGLSELLRLNEDISSLRPW